MRCWCAPPQPRIFHYYTCNRKKGGVKCNASHGSACLRVVAVALSVAFLLRRSVPSPPAQPKNGVKYPLALFLPYCTQETSSAASRNMKEKKPNMMGWRRQEPFLSHFNTADADAPQQPKREMKEATMLLRQTMRRQCCHCRRLTCIAVLPIWPLSHPPTWLLAVRT